MPEDQKYIKYRTEYVRRKRFSARQLQIVAVIALVVVIGILLAVILTGL